MKPAEIAAAAARSEKRGIYPWHNMSDYDPPEGTPEEFWKCRVLRVLIDSDEGRAYEKLSTDTERLEYMRKHAQDTYDVVRTSTIFYADWENGKEYRIKINSPEHAGLQKLMKEDGGSWAPDDKEYGAMIQYFKDHATTVADVPVRLDRQ
jgi:hypothetical protein